MVVEEVVEVVVAEEVVEVVVVEEVVEVVVVEEVVEVVVVEEVVEVVVVEVVVVEVVVVNVVVDVVGGGSDEKGREQAQKWRAWRSYLSSSLLLSSTWYLLAKPQWCGSQKTWLLGLLRNPNFRVMWFFFFMEF